MNIKDIYEKNNGDYARTLSELIKTNKNISKQSIKLQLDEYIKKREKKPSRISTIITIMIYLVITIFIMTIIGGLIVYIYSEQQGYGEIFLREIFSLNTYKDLMRFILVPFGMIIIGIVILSITKHKTINPKTKDIKKNNINDKVNQKSQKATISELLDREDT